MIKNPFKKILDPDVDPNHSHNLINCFLYHCLGILKISSKSLSNFLSNAINRKTNEQTNQQTTPPPPKKKEKKKEEEKKTQPKT